MNITPLFDRVLLKPEAEQLTTGGIYIPQTQTERSRIMQVVSVGSGTTTPDQPNPMVSVGDRVVVHKYAGTELVVANDKYYIVKQCDILAKLGY